MRGAPADDPTHSAIKELAGDADRRLFRRIDRALDRLAEEPQAGQPLHGLLHRHRSLRVGSLRIVYRFEADLLLVLVLSTGERGRVYGARTGRSPLSQLREHLLVADRLFVSPLGHDSQIVEVLEKLLELADPQDDRLFGAARPAAASPPGAAPGCRHRQPQRVIRCSNLVRS